MPLPSSTSPYLGQAFIQVIGQATGIRQQAVEALAALQAGPVNTAWIFSMIDQMRDAMARFDRFKNVAGLNGRATAEVPGYVGSMTSDIAATQLAMQDCIDWIVANFPKAASGEILAQTLNVDGTRTPRSFSSIQTAGFATKLQALIATIAA